ncbi:MAG: helix-turn-helix transcriptional regulator [Planctomycetes bacterium]|nr:helix-turn-helix transcriptional regulator [Planctomycetota bacterium]MBL7041311.1 helix-turn-helix transcriptional regulator [Pirellulaceae bacterium]
MASIKLTKKQKDDIRKAKVEGKRSVIVEPTKEQKEAYQETLAAVEAEREEITRRALAALIEQRQFELHMAQIALLLCAARQERGLSLQQLSDLTGISRPALSRIESGDNKNPTLNTLLRIARALGKEIVVSLRDAA